MFANFLLWNWQFFPITSNIHLSLLTVVLIYYLCVLHPTVYFLPISLTRIMQLFSDHLKRTNYELLLLGNKKWNSLSLSAFILSKRKHPILRWKFISEEEMTETLSQTVHTFSLRTPDSSDECNCKNISSFPSSWRCSVQLGTTQWK